MGAWTLCGGTKKKALNIYQRGMSRAFDPTALESHHTPTTLAAIVRRRVAHPTVKRLALAVASCDTWHYETHLCRRLQPGVPDTSVGRLKPVDLFIREDNLRARESITSDWRVS